jgi:hypothetical protein
MTQQEIKRRATAADIIEILYDRGHDIHDITIIIGSVLSGFGHNGTNKIGGILDEHIPGSST